MQNQRIQAITGAVVGWRRDKSVRCFAHASVLLNLLPARMETSSNVSAVKTYIAVLET